MEVTNKYIVIKHHIEDSPKESHFEVKTEAIGLSLKPGSDEVIIKNLYISIDPYLINRMKSYSASHNAISFATPLTPGQVLITCLVLKILDVGEVEFGLFVNNLCLPKYAIEIGTELADSTSC